MKTKTIILLITVTLIVGGIVWLYQEAKKRRSTLPQQLNQPVTAPTMQTLLGGGGGGGGTPTGNGFTITGVGQVVTGASPLQSWHTVSAPARVINIQANPAGTYSGTITVNGHTENVPSLEVNAAGYPAFYFNPTNPVWGITTAGTYQIILTLTISGTVYTQTTTTVVTNTDLGTGGNGFVITGVGQVVTGASPLQSWHTVAAPARVINIDATPDGTYSGSITVNGHTETVPSLEVNAAGYPAFYFNPTNPVWGITTAGTYVISISLTIAGVVYTRTTTTTVSNEDLGITGTIPPPINGGGSAVASSVRIDKINIVKNDETGLYSDIYPDVNGWVKYYYVNGFPYLNTDGSRKPFVNESLRAGLIMEVGVLYLDPAHYPTYASWITNGWQTKIAVYQIYIGGEWIVKTPENQAANPTAPTRTIYPNDGWVLGYAQQDFITA